MPVLNEFAGCCGARLMTGVTLNRPTEEQYQSVYRARGTAGVIVFTDNAQTVQFRYLSACKTKYEMEPTFSNGGKRWAQFIREKGFRVDEIYLGGNPNHQEVAPHFLTMYIWYVNKEKDKESVYVGEQPKKAVFTKIADSVFGTAKGFRGFGG